MSRKTFNVEELKTLVNGVCLNTKDEDIDFRNGQIVILDHVLHSTGTYHGYNYLDAHDMESSRDGTTVGVKEFDEVSARWNFEGTDDTRRVYY